MSKRMAACGHLGLQTILLYFSLPPAHPNDYIFYKMAASLQVELSAMMDIVKAHDKLAEFFLKEGILDTEAEALLAGTVDKLEEKIFPMLKAGGVPIDQLKDQVAIKKLWRACRSRMNAPQKPSSAAGDQSDEALPHVTRANLVTPGRRSTILL